MIKGIGTDFVDVNRVIRNLDKYGDRFARRILSDNEMRAFQATGRKGHFLAKRFAAKEATAKAFGTGFRNGLSLRHIEVKNDNNGRPMLHFNGVAQHLQHERAIECAHLSLSDEQHYALAFVILE